MTTHDRTPDERQDSIEAADNGDDGGSRRRFLSRSAIAGGALLTLGSGVGLSMAQEDDGDSEQGTDVDVLNYALTLEHLENAFYREALDTFDASDFAESDATPVSDEEEADALYANLQTIGDHEAAHVDVLTQTVEELGGTPVEEAEYDFGLDDVSAFLSLASTLENTGVAAYAGAAPAIESPELLQTALGVHSVEARHAAVVAAAGGSDPYPNVVDEPASQSEVLEAVGPLIVTDSGDEDGDEEADDGDEEGEGSGTDGDGEDGSPTEAPTETPTGTPGEEDS